MYNGEEIEDVTNEWVDGYGLPWKVQEAPVKQEMKKSYRKELGPQRLTEM